jgi:hypothetical protein
MPRPPRELIHLAREGEQAPLHGPPSEAQLIRPVRIPLKAEGCFGSALGAGVSSYFFSTFSGSVRVSWLLLGLGPKSSSSTPNGSANWCFSTRVPC